MSYALQSVLSKWIYMLQGVREEKEEGFTEVTEAVQVWCHCPLSTINCPLSPVHRQLSTVH